MAFQFSPKKEQRMPAMFTLKARVEYVIESMSGEMRVATDKDKGGKFLLGVAGQQIEMLVALKLGLVEKEDEKAEIKNEEQPKPKKKAKVEGKE